MPKPNQESTAWRFQQFNDGYDCEPPPGVRAELIQPKRPRILGYRLPVKTEQPRWPFYIVLTISLIVLAGAIYTAWRQQATERAPSTPSAERPSKAISQAVREPQPVVAPTPARRLASNPPAPRTMQAIGVPRAQLAQHSAPRAQLVSLPASSPPLFVGGKYLATMPYDNNLEVLATFRGWLPSQDDLPSHRNSIGDMFVIKGIPWVWVWAPGAAHADWIDP